MAEKDNASNIQVDLVALRQARADRAMARDPLEIVDLTAKLQQLKEFTILSSFARRKDNEQ